MGIFKGMKDRMKAVDNLTEQINNADSESIDEGEKEKKNKGVFGGMKDRMKAVDNLSKQLNDDDK